LKKILISTLFILTIVGIAFFFWSETRIANDTDSSLNVVANESDSRTRGNVYENQEGLPESIDVAERSDDDHVTSYEL